MDRYYQFDNITDKYNAESDYYMHQQEQLRPLTCTELIRQELFDDVDSMFSLGHKAGFLG